VQISHASLGSSVRPAVGPAQKRLFWPILDAERTIVPMEWFSIRRVLVPFGAGLPLLSLAAGGCARRDQADRSVEQLRADITKLQADRDRLDQRLGALETAEEQRDPADTHKTGAASSSQARVEAPRRLPVVHLGEGENGSQESQPPEPESDDPRPVVQATGSPSAAKRGRLGSRDETAANASAFSPEAKRSYESALTLVRSKQYDKALDALSSFLVRFPDHPYAENATYWRGECFYAKGEYARAVEQFEGVIARFPFGNKTPDAMLKLGLCQQKLGSQDQAMKTFAELRDRYPKSDAVRQVPRP
jgi:tol-pal system protein YbgF